MLQKSNFISDYRGAVIELLNALDKLRNLRMRYDALNYSAELTDADFANCEMDINAACFANAVYSVGELEALLNAGHKTNLYRLV